MTTEQRALLEVIKLTCSQMRAVSRDAPETQDNGERMFHAGMRYVLNDLQPKIEQLAMLFENTDQRETA